MRSFQDFGLYGIFIPVLSKPVGWVEERNPALNAG